MLGLNITYQWRIKWRKSHPEIYRQQKVMVNQQIKRVKSHYYNELFSKMAKDQRHMFHLTDFTSESVHFFRSVNHRRIWPKASISSLPIK